MTTGLFLLRCVEMGVSLRDLDLVSVGAILDMWIEKGNDTYKYPLQAGQAQFDAF